ncbi:MAG: leucine-rich repeat domain-containing protein [Lachnospiraceae bacterium]|nr:leucine-rich repeat domain-containing protein [Lachnospiraceae bacterium]
MDDSKLHIVSITLSNLGISGTVDLKDCVYLDSVSFSNSHIEYVVLPNSIQSLGSTSFSNCSSLIFVELTSDEIAIGRNAFSGCINLRTLLNTDSITSIGTNAFNKCSKVMFYGDTKSNYAYEYAKNNKINFSTNKTVTAYCYVGIMLNKEIDTVDLTNDGIPYHTGYLENDYGTFYADSEGLIEFDIDLGSRQNVVIDGKTAITRNASFIIPYKNYEINSKSNAIGIIVFDYIGDEYVNGKDYVCLTKYVIGSDADENYCYDLNGDGLISDYEQSIINKFFSTSADSLYKLYISWK